MVLDDKSCCGKTEHSFFMVFVFTRYSKKKKKKKVKLIKLARSQSTVQPSQMTYDKSKMSP
jgi:hypothetical protein